MPVPRIAGTDSPSDYPTVQNAVADEVDALRTDLGAETTARTAHGNATTTVHGIADTAALETQSGAQGKVDAHSADTTAVHGIADTAALETQSGAAAKVAAHEADTTAVHGIADTAQLVLTSDARMSDARTPTDGSVADAKLSTTNLTFLPRYFTCTSQSQARPTWGGPVVWIVTYTPFSQPSNTVVGDHVIDAST